jgi:CheY-like chemotaxis protein
MTTNSSVLVIDDEKDIRDMLSFALKANGFTVSTAADGLEGIDSIRREAPGAVVLDLMMPRMNGYEVIDTMRDEGWLNNVPVVILTARNLDDAELGRLDGARGVFQKGAMDIMTFVKRFSTLVA